MNKTGSLQGFNKVARHEQGTVRPDPSGQSLSSDDAAVLPDWLVSLETIDTDPGLKNCGSADGYLAVLGTFHKTAEYKEKEIRKYFEDSDLENFTVKVHALKSSARIIGATELSLLAEKLETAGREKNMELIKSKVQEMLKLYNETSKVLSQLGN